MAYDTWPSNKVNKKIESMELISTHSELEQFCTQLNPELGIAIDTEFMRQNTFFAIPAVVQIAQDSNAQSISMCIDATKISDWSSLIKKLEAVPFCLAHSPDQDFEIFDQLFGHEWDFTIYDTQVAAALLGEQPQISYAKIIDLILGLEIDKSQSRTDWLRRPLSKAQIDYALADVIHLGATWEKLKEKLEHQDRLNWFYADCQRAILQHKTTEPSKKAWGSVKGIKRLNGKKFAIAASLAAWREEKARKADIPRRWLLPDDAILDLAEANETVKSLKNKWSVLAKNEQSVMDLIENPLEIYQNYPTYHFEPLNAVEKSAYKAIKAYCNTQAELLKLDPAVIANRKTLEKIVRGNKDFLDPENWRHALLLKYLETL